MRVRRHADRPREFALLVWSSQSAWSICDFTLYFKNAYADRLNFNDLRTWRTTFWKDHIVNTAKKVYATLTFGTQCWDVGITNQGNKVRMHRGWNDFAARANLLQSGTKSAQRVNK